VLQKTLLACMTPIAEEALKKEDEEEHPSDKKEYWQNELKSLGIESKRQNDLNDKAELQALAEIIKAVYYQDYKTAYGNSSSNNNNNNNKE
jgi:hypothetical protein